MSISSLGSFSFLKASDPLLAMVPRSFSRSSRPVSYTHLPFIAVVEACCGALRGVAETKSSLGLSLVTNLGYMLLNVLFLSLIHISPFVILNLLKHIK